MGHKYNGGAVVSHKRIAIIQNELKDLSKRVEAMEKQMKYDKEEQLKELKAELDYTPVFIVDAVHAEVEVIVGVDFLDMGEKSPAFQGLIGGFGPAGHIQYRIVENRLLKIQVVGRLKKRTRIFIPTSDVGQVRAIREGLNTHSIGILIIKIAILTHLNPDERTATIKCLSANIGHRVRNRHTDQR